MIFMAEVALSGLAPLVAVAAGETTDARGVLLWSLRPRTPRSDVATRRTSDTRRTRDTRRRCRGVSGCVRVAPLSSERTDPRRRNRRIRHRSTALRTLRSAPTATPINRSQTQDRTRFCPSFFKVTLADGPNCNSTSLSSRSVSAGTCRSCAVVGITTS